MSLPPSLSQSQIKLLEDFLLNEITDSVYLKMLDGGDGQTNIVTGKNFRIDNQKVNNMSPLPYHFTDNISKSAKNISPQRINLQIQSNKNAKDKNITKLHGRSGSTGQTGSKSSSQTLVTMLIELPAHKSLTAGRLRHFLLTIINPAKDGKYYPSNQKGIVRTE